MHFGGFYKSFSVSNFAFSGCPISNLYVFLSSHTTKMRQPRTDFYISSSQEQDQYGTRIHTTQLQPTGLSVCWIDSCYQLLLPTVVTKQCFVFFLRGGVKLSRVERRRDYCLDCHLWNVYTFSLVFGDPDCP